MPKLPEDVQSYIVQALACFDTPSTVAEAVNKIFGINLTRQSVERYDPTKAASRGLSKKWAALFEATRSAFLADQASIGISHRNVRLRALDRMAARAEFQGNLALAAQLHEQAAKETGDLYTNRRQLTGKDGKQLFPVKPITPEMTDQEALEAYAATLEATAA